MLQINRWEGILMTIFMLLALFLGYCFAIIWLFPPEAT